MYSLAAYSTSSMSETWVSEHSRHLSSPKLSMFGSFNIGSLRDSFRSKSSDRVSIGSGSPTIESYRQSIKSRNKSSTISSSSKNSNSGSSISSSGSSISNSGSGSSIRSISNSSCTTNSIHNNASCTIKSSISNENIKRITIQNKTYFIHRIVLDQTSLDTTCSSVDEDVDLYEFDIYEDERRYRPILKRTSKYGPSPITNSPKPAGIWRLFGSKRKPQDNGNPTWSSDGGVSSAVGSADSPKTKRQFPDVFSKVNGCESPLPGSPRLKHLLEDASSDAGYSSDEGPTKDKDHFQLPQSLEKEEEKKRVHFPDPLVTHVYRLTYKSYLPRDAAIVTLKV